MVRWIRACWPPWTWTRRPPAVRVSPGTTVVTRSPRPDSIPATGAGAQTRRSGSASAAAIMASTSQWSGCSWVTSTAWRPSRAAVTSENIPGSITSPLSPSVIRTQEWVYLVSSIAPERTPDGVHRDVSVRQQRYRQTLATPQQYAAGDSGGAEAIPYPVERTVEGGRLLALERQRELDSRVVVEVGQGHAHQGHAAVADHRERRPQQPTGGRQDGLGVAGGVRQRVRSGRPLEVLKPHPQDYGSAHAMGAAQPAGQLVDKPHEVAVDLVERLVP